MPRRASYSLATVQALPTQTVYASADATRRHMLAAEALVAAIEPGRVYELGEAIRRVVGVAVGGSDDAPVSGRILRADLATLVLDLSERLGLHADARPGGAASPEELAREIGVASKTLQRWRRQGLLAHWVIDSDGAKPRVAIYRECLAHFASRHPAEFDRARSFRRFDASERARLLEEGRRMLDRGESLNLAAKRLSAEFGRSHEGVRLLFLRELGMTTSARRSGSERAARFAERAWRFGLEPARIAQRLGKSESLVRALVDRRRGELLRGVQPSWVELPTFDLPGADETIPSAPAARRLQPLGLVDGELFEMLASARALRRLFARDGRAAAERDETRAAAMHYLLRRASRAIDALSRWPDRLGIDQIETDLRAALRLRALLAERGLVIALGRADAAFEGGPERLPLEELRTLVRALVASVHEVVGAFDPSRQRFDRAISLAADYAIAKIAPSRRPTRAAARHTARVELSVLREVAQWQGLVDPMAHHAQRVVDEIAGRGANRVAAQLVARRHGFAGHAPATVETLAAEERTTVALMTKRLREAERAIRAAV
jgi:hypothetical protein